MESGTIKAAAYEYWEKGCNIVLLREKKPLHEWQKWISQRQTLEEFESLPWAEATQYAVVCGTELSNGMFFCAIDLDVKNLSAESIEKGRRALKKFPTTRIEQTPSKGLHYLYLSKAKPNTVSAFHNEVALELLGSGKLCICYPSQEYLRLNDNTLTEVQDLESLFYEELSSVAVKAERKTLTWFEHQDLRQGFKGQNPPCIAVLMRGTVKGSRNDYGIRLASYSLNFRKHQPSTVQKIMKEWNRLNLPPLDTQKLDDLMRTATQGEYVYGCHDSILEKLCNRDECPICPKTVILSDEQKRTAEEILERTDLLKVVKAHGKKQLIGEDNALLINFIEFCSGQTLYPISGVISGFSGSGKNESLRAIKGLIPEEWIFEFTTSTPEAIKYLPEEFTGTLVIYESSGVSNKTGTGSMSLRAVGEGESIETIYPMKDELTGKMILGRAKTNAKNFITTDSEIDIQADLYRRVLKHTMRSDSVLTKRVCIKEMRECYLPESLRMMITGEPFYMVDPEEFQNALRVQNWKAEVIVFVEKELLALIQVASTIEQTVAIRTQFKKILNFIQVLALLNQKHREQFTVKEKKYVIAGPDDYKLGLAILSDTILETISRVEDRQKATLELFNGDNQLTKNDVAEKLHCSGVTAARALKTLANNGYLKEFKTSKPYSYQKIRDKPDSLVMLTDTSHYDGFYQKELEYYRNHILSLVTRDHPVSDTNLHEKSTPMILTDSRHSLETSDKIPSKHNFEVIEQINQKQLVFLGKTSKNDMITNKGEVEHG